MRHPRFLFACLAVLYGISSVPAQALNTVVHWDGNDYIPWGPGGNKRFRGIDPTPIIGIDVNNDQQITNETRIYYDYNITDTPLNPPCQSATICSYDITQDSAIFYGGIVGDFVNVDFDGTVKFQESLVIGKPNIIKRPILNLINPVRATGDLTDDEVQWGALFLWRKDGFLNNADANNVTVSFDPTSNLFAATEQLAAVADGRFVVQDGSGQFYTSEFTFAPQLKNWVRSENSVSPMNTRWAPYSPSGLYDIEFDPATAVFDFHTFVDIQMLGIYFGETEFIHSGINDPANYAQHLSPHGVHNWIGLSFQEFRVDALVTPIPTPGTGASLFLMSLGLSRRTRRG